VEDEARPMTMPPFREVIKSPEVEDPVNLYFNRPIAYAFVWAVRGTKITPNGVTLLSVIVGAMAGAAFLIGSKEAMIMGGALLWASAILDGADGILARAKNVQSPYGRAIDGLADSAVAVMTVLPAFYHLWVQHQSWFIVALMAPAVFFANVHMAIHDYFKESFLHHTRVGSGGEGEDPDIVAARVEEAKGVSRLAFVAMKIILAPYTARQFKLIRWIDPKADREGLRFCVTPESAELYRTAQVLPMRIWTILSTAPHAYLMAICAMFDRLDIYLYIRVFAMNAVMLLNIPIQRAATEKTAAMMREMGAVIDTKKGPELRLVQNESSSF
jgi:phosphatidylglycerophosphate synthase